MRSGESCGTPWWSTGYQGFGAGNNTYALSSNSVTAPASAYIGDHFFHFAGSAITNQYATIDIDDVALGLGGGSGNGCPCATNILLGCHDNRSSTSVGQPRPAPNISPKQQPTLRKGLGSPTCPWSWEMAAPSHSCSRCAEQSVAYFSRGHPACGCASAIESQHCCLWFHQCHRAGVDSQPHTRSARLSHSRWYYQRKPDQFN